MRNNTTVSWFKSCFGSEFVWLYSKQDEVESCMTDLFKLHWLVLLILNVTTKFIETIVIKFYTLLLILFYRGNYFRYLKGFFSSSLFCLQWLLSIPTPPFLAWLGKYVTSLCSEMKEVVVAEYKQSLCIFEVGMVVIKITMWTYEPRKKISQNGLGGMQQVLDKWNLRKRLV